jgi:hypothetical protein
VHSRAVYVWTRLTLGKNLCLPYSLGVPVLDFSKKNQPGRGPDGRKLLPRFLGVAALIGAITFGSTFAASINLNSGAPVEFGQGIAQVTACDSNIALTPVSSFVNSDYADFMFAGITLSGVDSTDQSESSEGCAGKGFTIKAYGSGGSYLGATYTIIVGSNSFSSGEGSITSSGGGTESASATLTFDNPTISAGDVYQITIESSVIDECSLSSDLSWSKIYELVDPTRGGGQFNYVSGYGIGGSDAAASYASSTDLICDIRYRMELVVDATTYYADVSFDAWDGVGVSNLQIPDGDGVGQNFVLQRNVSNMSVASNYPGVDSGDGLDGRLEIWPGNYGQGHSGLLPQGNSGSYDFDDWGEATPGYGSFQVHNLRDSETVLAWNNHGSSYPDVGFGRGGVSPDWTFDNSLFLQGSSWKLSIYVR